MNVPGLEEIRQYYNRVPYPSWGLEISHLDKLDVLYTHNLITSYYLRNRRLIKSEGRTILDAGCGSGFTTLALAQANPEAKLVAIDISPESIAVARARLAYHGFNQVEFQVLPIEEAARLGTDFDYINCDEVLYIVPDPVVALKALASVLKPEGILRTNLHDKHQRALVYRAQQAFQIMSAHSGTSGPEKVALVQEVMESLRDNALLKRELWSPTLNRRMGPEWISLNYLLDGDKGYTVPDLFRMLEAAGLDFISMLLWPAWELVGLFRDPQNLPASLRKLIAACSLEERLHLFELLEGSERLLDFWCGHPGQNHAYTPLQSLDPEALSTAHIHLHPQLQSEQLKADLLACIADQTQFDFNRYLRAPCGAEIKLDSIIAQGLLPLWNGPQPLGAFIDRWVESICSTNAAIDPLNLAAELQHFIFFAENFLYFLIERPHPLKHPEQI